MWTIDPPDFEATEVFTTCIRRVRNAELRNRLTAVTGVVQHASDEFRAAARRTVIHTIPSNEIVGGNVSADEMIAVYTQRMAKKGSPGRDYYDRLIAAAPHGKCPLCGQRIVATLDHHLPKFAHPSLAVAPVNLVPCCIDCNKAKLAAVPTTSEEESLHPYFDEIDGSRWLSAALVQGAPSSLRYSVTPPDRWSDVLKSRVNRHFRTLALGRLYSIEAADELSSIKHQLQSILRSGGPNTVRVELQARFASASAVRRNGWRTAAFEAWSRSDWFCDGGFFT